MRGRCVIGLGFTIIAILCICPLSILVENGIDYYIEGNVKNHSLSDYTPHIPFTIFSDAEFAAQGWPGSGSAGDPFVIENLSIVTNDQTAIIIQDTSVNFVIRNCQIESRYAAISMWYNSGIYNISECTITSNGDALSSAISVGYGNNCTISNNDISSMISGISVYASDFANIHNNTIKASRDRGISIRQSHNSKVYYNSIDDCPEGILNDASLDIEIFRNHITNASTGISSLYWNGPVTIENNTVENSEIGISIGGKVDVVNNTLMENSLCGLFLTDNVWSNITGNQFIGRGIMGWEDINNVWYNEFDNNTINGKPFGYFRGVSNAIVNASEYGQIVLNLCQNVTVQNGKFDNTSVGVTLAGSESCTLKNITFVNDGVFVWGLHTFANWNHTAVDCTVNGKELAFIVNENNQVIDCGNYGQIILVGCTNIVLRNGTLTNVPIGIESGFNSFCEFENMTISALSYGGVYNLHSDDTIIESTKIQSAAIWGIRNMLSPRLSVSNTTISNCREEGIYTQESDGCSILDNNILDSGENGIYIVYQKDCIVYNNTIDSCDSDCILVDVCSNTTLDSNSLLGSLRGLSAFSSFNFTVVDNIVSRCDYAFSLYYQETTNVISNNITDCTVYNINSRNLINSTIRNNIIIGGTNGIFFEAGCENNSIYHNTISAQQNAWDDGSNNIWDDNVSIGNSWSDYSGSGSYIISGSAGSVDRFPIPAPDTTPPSISGGFDFDYLLGSTGSYISWSAGDANPLNYEIYLDQNLILDYNWNGGGFSTNVDNLRPGLHNYTAVVYDTNGNSASDTVFVNVTTDERSIIIMSNSDFADYGFPGSGTASIPYVIENLNIISIGVCFYIIDTDAHYIAKNCTMYLPFDFEGNTIYIENVTHGTFQNCTFLQGRNGVNMESSTSINFTDCIFRDSYQAASAIDCHNSTISYSKIENCPYGLSFTSSDNCNIENNTISSLYEGFTIVSCDNSSLSSNIIDISFLSTIYSSSNCKVQGNSFSGSRLSIRLSYNCTFSNNTFSDQGIVLSGDPLSFWIHHFENNSIDGKMIGYFLNETDTSYDISNYGQVILVNSKNVTMTNGTISSAYHAISFGFCNECTIEDNEISLSTSYGIWIYRSDNSTVIDNQLLSNVYGMHIEFSPNSTIGYNLFQGNKSRLLMESSGSSSVVNNTMIDAGVMMWGYTIQDWNVTIENNTVNSKPLLYVFDVTSSVIDGSGYGEIILGWCVDVTVINGTFNNSYVGFQMGWCENCTIKNSSVYGNRFGIQLFECSDCTIEQNDVSFGNQQAITLVYSVNCIVRNNTICANTFSVSIFYTGGNWIYWNDIGWNSDPPSDYYAPNFWDDGIGTGNAWSDYSGAGAYQIGWSSSFDYFPSILFDTRPPLICQPQDMLFKHGDTGYTLSWYALDYTPSYFIVYENSSIIDVGSWSGETISISLDGLNPGLHNYTALFADSSGNWATSMVWVRVIDTLAPNIDSPLDVMYEGGTTNHNITWTTFDHFPSFYNLTLDDFEISSGEWNETSISVPVDGLLPGTYNYTLYVYDISGNNASDSVLVHVVDTIAPTISDPPDVDYEEGCGGNNIEWSASDLYPNAYILYQDDSEIDSGFWDSSPIQFNIDGLSPGVYNFTLIVNDTSGNYQSDSLQVDVLPSQPPIIDSPANIVYEAGTADHWIHWSPSDAYPDSYEIFRNETQIAGTSWDGTQISFNVDGYDPGVYNFTLIVYDCAGNSAVDVVLVFVEDTTSPTIDNPADIEFEEGSTDHTIIWNPFDLYPLAYQIYRDETEVESGTWTGSQISISLDSLPPGSYNYTLYVNDTSGNIAMNRVEVLIHSSNPPSIDDILDFSYELGILSQIITWHPFDLFPATYRVLLDDVEITNTTWSGGDISIDVGGKPLGEYKYTLIVYDHSGNIASDHVVIDVIDTTSPSLSEPLDTEYEEGSTGHAITWTVSDLDPDNYEIWRNETLIDSGPWSGGTISISVDGHAEGFLYNYTILIFDGSGNNNTDTVFIDVLSPLPPSISNIQHLPAIVTSSDSVTISCTVIDVGVGVSSVTLYYRINGTIWNQMMMTSIGANVYSGTLSPLPYSSYVHYYINASDTLTLWAIDDNYGLYFNYTVSDVTPPTITDVLQTPGLPTYEDDVNVTCIVTDDESGVGIVFLYYRLNQTEWITLAMTELLNDTYSGVIPKQPWNTLVEYYINATDLAGNFAIKTYEGEPFQGGIVTDPVDPVVEEPIREDENPEPETTVGIRCNISDIGSGVVSAWLYYRVNGGIWFSVSMTWISGNVFWGAIPSQPWNAAVEYYINATDAADNFAVDNNGGFYYSYIVGDSTNPTINIDAPADSSDVQGIVSFNVTATDGGSGIIHVSFYIGITLLVTDDLHPYNCAWDSTLYSNGAYTLRAVAYDNAGNYEEATIEIMIDNPIDEVGPSITFDYSPLIPSDTDDVVVSSTIEDTSGVIQAILSYSVNSGTSWTNITMVESTPYWTATIPAQSAETIVLFKILAEDTVGNWGESEQGSYVVGGIDSSGPIIAISMKPLLPTYADDVTITVNAFDSSGISEIILSYSTDEGTSWSNNSMTFNGGNWTYIITKQVGNTVVMYKVFAQDTVGNWAVEEGEPYTVLLKTSLDLALEFLQDDEILNGPRTLRFLEHDYDIYEYLNASDDIVGIIIVNRTSVSVAEDEDTAFFILLYDAITRNWDSSGIRGVSNADVYWYNLGNYWESRHISFGSALLALMIAEALSAPFRGVSVIFDALSSLTGISDAYQYFSQFEVYAEEISTEYSTMYGPAPAIEFLSTLSSKGGLLLNSIQLALSDSSISLELFGTSSDAISNVADIATGILSIAFFDDIDTAISDSFMQLMVTHQLSVTAHLMSILYGEILDGNANLKDYMLLYNLQLHYYLIAKGLSEWRASVLTQYLNSNSIIFQLFEWLGMISQQQVTDELDAAQSYLDTAMMVSDEWGSLGEETESMIALMINRLAQNTPLSQSDITVETPNMSSIINFPLLFLLPICSVSSKISEISKKPKKNKKALLGVVVAVVAVVAITIVMVNLSVSPSVPTSVLPTNLEGYTVVDGPEDFDLSENDLKYFDSVSQCTYESYEGEAITVALLDCVNESSSALWLTCMGSLTAGLNSSLIDSGGTSWQYADLQIGDSVIRITWKNDIILLLSGASQSEVNNLSEGITEIIA